MLNPTRRVQVATVSIVSALACSTSTPRNAVVATVGPASARGEASDDSIHWMQISTDSGVILAAVARPRGPGPFPALIILHGTHGFADEYVQFAREMARNGVMGIAACWFRGRQGAGSRFIRPIECPDAPRLVNEVGTDRFQIARGSIDAVVRKVRTMPNVRTDRVVLFGQSRGGGAALDYVLTHHGKVQAAVLNSTGYPSELGKRASEIDVPLLLLHGTADDPADGGSPFSNIEMVRRFEATVRGAGKQVNSKYYEGGRHNGFFTDTTQHLDTVQRIMSLLRSLSE